MSETIIDLRQGKYQTVLHDAKADLIVTSPPYNIGSTGERKDGFRSSGKPDPKSYGGITGYEDDLDEATYQDQQTEFVMWAAEHLTENGVLVYNHKPRRKNGAMIHPILWLCRPEVTRVLTLMEEIVWDRSSTHNHCPQLMWQQTERLYVFRRADGKYPLRNTSDLDFRNDLWKVNRPAKRNGHACPFPVPLAEACVKAWSIPGDTVMDPYAGSGTTAIAAHNLGRNFIGAEFGKQYHKDALKRIAEETSFRV
jgi:modification methylase